MPSKSQAQQRLFGIAHAIQKGEMKPGQATGAARRIARDVSKSSVTDFAKTKHKGLPPKKACGYTEAQVNEIVRQVLEDDENVHQPEEAQEVAIAQTIIRLAEQLSAALPNPTPEVTRHLTGIRASAHQLIRIHHAG